MDSERIDKPANSADDEAGNREDYGFPERIFDCFFDSKSVLSPVR